MSSYKNTPKLSILMLAYNHEKYIRQALDGILMQKVDFTYEIVIGEDCSQDNTRAILLDYKERYPDKIKLILHEKNVGMNANVNAVRKECTGKYCANCEGDDYWVDEYKLKKQIGFLENHPEYVGTSHKVEVVDEDGKTKSGHNSNMYCQDTTYTIKHAEKGILPGQSATLVYRNILFNNPSDMMAVENCKANGDMKIALYLAMHGNIYCFNEIMSHYRWVTEQGSSWSAKMKDKNLNLYLFNSYRELEKLAKSINNIDMNYRNQYLGCGAQALVKCFKNPSKENFEIFKQIYKQYNNKIEMELYILKKLIIFPIRKIKRNVILIFNKSK